MTVWDFLDKFISISPPILAVSLIAAAGILFLIGFGKHGVDFLKHGFKQTALDASFEKRFSDMDASFEKRFNDMDASFEKRFSDMDASFEKRFSDMDASFEKRFSALDARIDGLRTELDTIRVNHFGHLKNYLSVLDAILLDKNILSNQDKARLDNELRGM